MVTTGYLSAYEHQSVSIDERASSTSVTRKEVDDLARIAESRRGFCEVRRGSVRLAQYCGVVSIGERILEILPKVDDGAGPEECRGLLLKLLKQADDFPSFRDSTTGQHLRNAPLLDVFISAFFDAVVSIVRAGLLRRYEQHEDDLVFVRGRIVSDRQFSVLANRRDRVACRFDELSANNVWNQVLKIALRVVRPWIRSRDLSRRWLELMAVFDEVSDIRADAHVFDRLVFDRRAKRYEAAIDWARWILRLLSPSLRAGERAAPGLLFDMNILFQSAVAASLVRRAHSKPSIQIQAQDVEHHFVRVPTTGRKAINLRPDLVVRKHGLVVGVGDTKWKRLDVDGSGRLRPAPADMYQMYAYASAYRCERLALIYPLYANMTGLEETLFELPRLGELRPTVAVICLDVSQESVLNQRLEEWIDCGESVQAA